MQTLSNLLFRSALHAPAAGKAGKHRHSIIFINFPSKRIWAEAL
ncbi:hypothetical protein [Allosphingosinicella flava]|nr:hypothetical protein [Sphingosinicella flava]